MFCLIKKLMLRMLKGMGEIFALCFSMGILISKAEQKTGWAGGHKPYGFYEREIKRPLDFGSSLFAIIFLWPIMLMTALAVRVKLGTPVLFRQERVGLGGNIFTIKKYRTMLDARGEDGRILPDEERLTVFGRMLRSTSLDELPELFQILCGDMSIVGPRPLLVEYLPRYNEEQKHRHDVRPGLTSLSASRERNLASWDDKFRDDLKYVEKITFLGDIKIIYDTLKIVFKREGIHSRTSATMEYFQGNQ